MKGSLVIILFLLGGALCGYVEVFPQEIVDQGWSAYALGALMFGVGLSIGHNPILLRSFRQIRPILFFLPLATIMGTLCASALVSLLLLHSSMAQSLAIGSGFGYYSLSSIFITEYRGAEAGTIALLSNIIREVIALLVAPVLVRFFGRLAPIAAAGATSMDTTLPIIVRCSGSDYTIVSIYHGFIVDFSVPFLVSFFCSSLFFW
ncbi:lysine exporter LysO family protein [Porphyromonas gulae]|uniref:lysine exporter LysO family protein n=1 Tax=Porphyromonas gulae TaxID=111105 RepID=UPI00052C1CE8|nr:lysine exporter LysO family protein [Porphyromonas gulae]KGN87430.1 membrane protein [Porphyromonas gulae]